MFNVRNDIFTDESFIDDVRYGCMDLHLRYTRDNLKIVGPNILHAGLMCMRILMTVNNITGVCIVDPSVEASERIVFETGFSDPVTKCNESASLKLINAKFDNQTKYPEMNIYDGYPEFIRDIGAIYLAYGYLNIYDMKYIMQTFYVIIKNMLKRSNDGQISILDNMRDIPMAPMEV